MKNYYSLAIALSLLIVVGVTVAFFSTKPVALDPAIRLADATLKDRTIVDFGVNADGVVAYSYLDAHVPAALDESEIVELRNENSYTKLIAIDESTKDPTLTLETRFYSQPAYAQDVDGSWRYLKYATTTQGVFRNRDMTLAKALVEMVVRTAYADTVSPFSSAGDGQAYRYDVDNTEFCGTEGWDIAHAATDADSVAPTATNSWASAFGNSVFVDPTWTCDGQIIRTFLPFDTSAIPSAATVSATTLNVYVNTKATGVNDGTDYITVVRSSQATHTTLAVADYDQCGTITNPTEGVDSGQRKDVTSISTGAYLVFTLNVTGIGWVAKSGASSNCSATAGITCLGLREGHDTTNNMPFSSTDTGINIANSEDSTGDGDDRDPYLEVTYSTASSAVQSGLKVGAYGSLKVIGGGIKIK